MFEIDNTLNIDCLNTYCLCSASQAFLAKQFDLAGLGSEWLYDCLSEEYSDYETAYWLGLEVDDWRTCLWGLVFQCHLLEAIPGQFESLDFMSQVFTDNHCEMCSRVVTSEEVKPFIDGLNNWHRWLVKHYFYCLQEADRQRLISMSKVNWHSALEGNRLVQLLAAFAIEEERRNLVRHLSLLGSKYGYRLVSQFEDQILVIGELPDAAASEASILAGLNFRDLSLHHLNSITYSSLS